MSICEATNNLCILDLLWREESRDITFMSPCSFCAPKSTSPSLCVSMGGVSSSFLFYYKRTEGTHVTSMYDGQEKKKREEREKRGEQETHFLFSLFFCREMFVTSEVGIQPLEERFMKRI